MHTCHGLGKGPGRSKCATSRGRRRPSLARSPPDLRPISARSPPDLRLICASSTLWDRPRRILWNLGFRWAPDVETTIASQFALGAERTAIGNFAWRIPALYICLGHRGHRSKHCKQHGARCNAEERQNFQPAWSQGVSPFFPGCFTLFSGGVSRRRGVTHLFRGCFAPARCYTHFPGVFRAAGCYTHFPGVFRAAGVLYTFSGGVSIQLGVLSRCHLCVFFTSLLSSATQVKKRHRRQRDSTPSWIERRRTQEFPTLTLDCPVREREVQIVGIVASAFVVRRWEMFSH
jgi:hypothetical protein